MAFRQHFLVGLAWRLGLLFLAAFICIVCVQRDGYAATALLSGLISLAALAALWRHVRRTDIDLARFLDAMNHGDFSYRPGRGVGGGFEEAGDAIERAVQRLGDERRRLADDKLFYEALLDDAPVALLTVDQQGRVALANKAARRLFPQRRGVRVEDFAAHGATFAESLRGGAATGPRLLPLTIDGVTQAAMVSVAAVHRAGGPVHAVAVQPIQSELNAFELSAQSDLIRVLTHEIMNSMTPVTSLARSAAGLLGAVEGGGTDLAEARIAVETLARRADGLMHFVESYRQLSRMPEVHRRRFALLPWARELEALFRASDVAEGVALQCSVEPPDLGIDADPDLLSQVLINLLRNGAEAAAAGSETPMVSMRFGAARNGATQIDITDNGPGIPPEIAPDIFLPFFTTKDKGTGVGLSVARQLVHAHRGSITMEPGLPAGAHFRVVI